MMGNDTSNLGALTCTRAEAQQMLEKQIAEGESLLEAADRVNSVEMLEAVRRGFRTWHEYNSAMLRKLFTLTTVAEQYQGRSFGFVFSPDPMGQLEQLYKDIDRRVRQLESLSRQLDLYDERPTAGSGRRTAVSGATTSTKPTVFIIHGTDREAALALQKMLGQECCEVEATMFEDRVNASLTIIENLEQMIGDSSFGLAIFTPDDFVDKGGGETYVQMRPNVVFELGWFYGHLGRSGAAVIKKVGTKVPSDLEGIYRIEYREQVDETLDKVRKALRSAGLIT